MKKLLVALFACASVAAYAQTQSYYQFTDANSVNRSPEVFNCITSSPGLICPGFVPTGADGNPLNTYNVVPTAAGQWGLGTTGAVLVTTAMYNGAGGFSTEPGKVTNGTLVGVLADLVGKLIVQPYAPRENFVEGSTSSATIAPQTIIAGQGVNLRMFITSVQCGRIDAGTTATYLTLNDTKRTILVLPNSGGGGGNNATYPVPLIVPSNTPLTMTNNDSIYTTCAAQGHTGY